MVFDDQIYFGENKYGVLAQIMVLVLSSWKSPLLRAKLMINSRDIALFQTLILKKSSKSSLVSLEKFIMYHIASTVF